MKFELPPDHQPGMRVPKGGSSCASCRYYKGDNKCGNSYFIKWHGSNIIPAPVDSYCSDWYEMKKSPPLGVMSRGLSGRKS